MSVDTTNTEQESFPWVTRDEVFRIETPRLWLRWPRLSDAAALQRIASHRSVAEMTSSWPHPLPDGEAARRIQAIRNHNRDGRTVVLAITAKGAPDDLIGTIGGGPPAEGTVSFGYMLAPAAHGRGLMTEAVAAFVRMLFTHTDVEFLAASSRVINVASRRVLEKNDFEVVRSGLYETKVRGSIDVDFLELDRSDWKKALTARRARLNDHIGPQWPGRDISVATDCLVPV